MVEPEKATFGEKIRYLRRVKKLSQTRLGELAFGLSGAAAQNRIKQIEHGERKFNPEEVVSLFDALGEDLNNYDKTPGRSVRAYRPKNARGFSRAVVEKFPAAGELLTKIEIAISRKDNEKLKAAMVECAAELVYGLNKIDDKYEYTITKRTKNWTK
jgi:transcriptional regulator with XRE-family HTH domain